MSDTAAKPADSPVFKNCVRCDYSLRGLPANHACPECGLRYDERCELFRVKNPWLAILVSTAPFLIGMRFLPELRGLPDFLTLSAWDRFEVLFAACYVLAVPLLVRFYISFYRRGQYVAVTGDGLILRLADAKDDLIPWRDITGILLADRPSGKSQIAHRTLGGGRNYKEIGGSYNVFPTRAHAERFVEQVRQRVAEANAEKAGDTDSIRRNA